MLGGSFGMPGFGRVSGYWRSFEVRGKGGEIFAVQVQKGSGVGGTLAGDRVLLLIVQSSPGRSFLWTADSSPYCE